MGGLLFGLTGFVVYFIANLYSMLICKFAHTFQSLVFNGFITLFICYYAGKYVFVPLLWDLTWEGSAVARDHGREEVEVEEESVESSESAPAPAVG